MKTAVVKALFKSYDYHEYGKLISDLLLEGKTTGNEQSEHLVLYSNLNVTRMNLLDKTIKISDEYEAWAIPKLIVVDKESGTIYGSWGPRPNGTNYFVEIYKEKTMLLMMPRKTNCKCVICTIKEFLSKVN